MVSVIIPTYQALTLPQTLLALKEQTAFDAIDEILVVGQQDGLPKIDGKMRYLHLADRPTPARNRNLGAARARTEWLCFTDSDCIPAPDWIETMQEAAGSTNAHALYGRVVVPAQTSYWGLCNHLFVFGPTLAAQGTGLPGKSAATLNFCVRRAVFAKLGAFDESFTSAAGEDLEFSQRLMGAGYDIAFVPAAVVEHHHPRQLLPESWRHLHRYGEATVQVRLRSQNDFRWRLAQRFARLPLLGEILLLMRVLMRALLRATRPPYNWRRYWHTLPGIALLDLSHSLGILHELRRTEEAERG